MKLERWKQRLWIIDGHNVIFSWPKTCRLQREGERSEARTELERLLEPFARELRRSLIIVYDGNEMITNPEGGAKPGFQILFSQPPEEEADDRIIFLASQATARNESVAIVTDDRRTLSSRLPLAAQVVGVKEFFERYLLPVTPAPTSEKSVPAETEQELAALFLSRENEIMKSAQAGAQQRAKRGLKRWQKIHGGASEGSSSDAQPDIDDNGEPIEHYNPRQRMSETREIKQDPTLPSKASGSQSAKAASEAKDRLQREIQIKRENKKKKGELKQKKRLARMKQRKGKNR